MLFVLCYLLSLSLPTASSQFLGLVCDTERNPKSFSTFPPEPLLGSSWSLPCDAPLSQLPSRAVQLQSNAVSQSQQVLGFPAQPLSTGILCRLCPSSMCGYTWQPQIPAVMRVGAARAIPTSGRPAPLADVAQSSSSFRTQKSTWSSSTIFSV